jgi:hypothetical protein
MTGGGKSVLELLPNDDMKDAYPNPEMIKKESAYTLKDIYDGEQYKGKVEVSYEYDHGDSWLHEIAFLGRADPSLRKGMNIPDDIQAVCLGGEVSVSQNCTPQSPTLIAFLMMFRDILQQKIVEALTASRI